MVNPLELAIEERPIRVTTGVATLEGDLGLPKKARGIVLFAHGSGSSRFSSRNRYVAAPSQFVRKTASLTRPTGG
jgi:hypothetical protein